MKTYYVKRTRLSGSTHTFKVRARDMHHALLQVLTKPGTSSYDTIEATRRPRRRKT